MTCAPLDEDVSNEKAARLKAVDKVTEKSADERTNLLLGPIGLKRLHLAMAVAVFTMVTICGSMLTTSSGVRASLFDSEPVRQESGVLNRAFINSASISSTETRHLPAASSDEDKSPVFVAKGESSSVFTIRTKSDSKSREVSEPQMHESLFQDDEAVGSSEKFHPDYDWVHRRNGSPVDNKEPSLFDSADDRRINHPSSYKSVSNVPKTSRYFSSPSSIVTAEAVAEEPHSIPQFSNSRKPVLTSSIDDFYRELYEGGRQYEADERFTEEPAQSSRRDDGDFVSITSLFDERQSLRDKSVSRGSQRDVDETAAGAEGSYYLYPPLDDLRQQPGTRIRLELDSDEEAGRNSYDGEPTVREPNDKSYHRPSKSNGRPQPTDSREESHWALRPTSTADRWKQNRSRPRDHNMPIVASINRDKGAVIHITLNQVPASKKPSTTTESLPQRDEPSPPAPPPTTAAPLPTPLPPPPIMPPFPFYGGYSQQQQMPPQMQNPASMMMGGYGYGGLGGGGFIVLPQPAGDKGGYYQQPLVIPLPPVYGGGHHHQGGYGATATTTTTTTPGPPAVSDEPDTVRPPTPGPPEEDKDTHSVILITPSKAKASVTVAGKTIKGIRHHVERPSYYTKGDVADDVQEFGYAGSKRPKKAGSSYSLHRQPAQEELSSPGSGGGGYGFSGRRFSVEQDSSRTRQKGKYITVKAPTKRVKMYITPSDLEKIYGGSNVSRHHLPIEAVATVEGPTILIKQASKTRASPAPAVPPPVRQSNPPSPPPPPPQSQGSYKTINSQPPPDPWRPVGPPGMPSFDTPSSREDSSRVQSFTVPSDAPGGKNYHYHFRITTKNGAGGSSMPSVSMDSLPPAGPVPPPSQASYPSLGSFSPQTRVLAFNNPAPIVAASPTNQQFVFQQAPVASSQTGIVLQPGVFGQSIQQAQTFPNSMVMMAQPPSLPPVSRPSPPKRQKGYGGYGAPMMDEVQQDQPPPSPQVVMPANLVIEPGLDVPQPSPPVHIHHFPKFEKKHKRKRAKKPNKYKHEDHHHYDNSYRRRVDFNG